jgi:hypothetical protein
VVEGAGPERARLVGEVFFVMVKDSGIYLDLKKVEILGWL